MAFIDGFSRKVTSRQLLPDKTAAAFVAASCLGTNDRGEFMKDSSTVLKERVTRHIASRTGESSGHDIAPLVCGYNAAFLHRVRCASSDGSRRCP